MNYTLTYADFKILSGIDQNEVDSSDYSTLCTNVVEPYITYFVELNGIDLGSGNNQVNVNLYGSLFLRRYLISNPTQRLLEKAGGGAGAVLRDTMSQVSARMTEILQNNGWVTVDLSGTVNVY